MFYFPNQQVTSIFPLKRLQNEGFLFVFSLCPHTLANSASPDDTFKNCQDVSLARSNNSLDTVTFQGSFMPANYSTSAHWSFNPPHPSRSPFFTAFTEIMAVYFQFLQPASGRLLVLSSIINLLIFLPASLPVGCLKTMPRHVRPLLWQRSFSRYCFYVVLVELLSFVRLFVSSWIVAHQPPLSMELSRREYWSG